MNFAWVGLGFLQSVSCIKSIRIYEKLLAGGQKSDPNATFDLICVGLGWPWLGWGVRRFHNNVYTF